MKYVSKLIHLLEITVFFAALFMVVLNITNGGTITIQPNDLLDAHKVRLKSLSLWTWYPLTGYYEIKLQWLNSFDIVGWLAVWTGATNISSGSFLVTIGWWKGNLVSWTWAWIVGWEANYINGWKNVVIWGGKNNNVGGEQSVVWGGNWNKVNNWSGVILGWSDNEVSDSSIVLWWQNNKANWKNNLLLGAKTTSSWKSSTFVWGDSSQNCSSLVNESATVCASKGVLIWTYNRLTGVNLVVNGAVKIAWGLWSWTAWEIKMVSWCVYSFDGSKRYIFGKQSKSDTSCTNLLGEDLGKICKFGKIELQEWDTVYAYLQPYSTNCDSVDNKHRVECKWWKLYDSTNSTQYIYPSCYNVSTSPII